MRRAEIRWFDGMDPMDPVPQHCIKQTFICRDQEVSGSEDHLPDRSGRLYPTLCGSMARHHAQVREGNKVLVPVPPRVKITSLIRGAAFTLLFVVLCSMARHYAQVREG